MWLRALPGEQGIILAQTRDQSRPGGENPVGFVPTVQILDDGRVHISIGWHGKDTQHTRIASDDAITDGRWHYLVGVYDNGQESLYIDDILVKTHSRVEHPFSGAYQYYLGTGFAQDPWSGVTFTGWDFFGGDLDEVAVYQRALDADEIKNHYLARAQAFSVSDNDVDVEGDTLNAILVDDVESGTLDLLADGSFSYTPNKGFTGIDSFTYIASDGQATSNVATVTIRVGVADVPADLTGNGFVDFEDLTVLLAAWNQNVSAARGNLVDAGGTPVNFEDLTVLLAAWTGSGQAGAAQAAVVGGDSVGDGGGTGGLVAVGDASYRRGEEAPRRAAAHGSATGVASYRARRAGLRSRSASGTYGGIGRLQAAAVDAVLGEEDERIVARRGRRSLLPEGT